MFPFPILDCPVTDFPNNLLAMSLTVFFINLLALNVSKCDAAAMDFPNLDSGYDFSGFGDQWVRMYSTFYF